MNAPFKPQVLEPVPNIPEQAAAVWVHYPHENGARLSIRCDLMAFRDRATVGLRRCCADAYPTLQEASRLATVYALANLPTAALFQMHIAVRSLIDAASAIEACHRPAKAGGRDARG
jgi:hypothetical protein